MWHTRLRPFLAMVGINLISSIMASWFLNWFAGLMVPVVSTQFLSWYAVTAEIIGWLVKWIRSWQTGIYKPWLRNFSTAP